jgi:hypothetical protein
MAFKLENRATTLSNKKLRGFTYGFHNEPTRTLGVDINLYIPVFILLQPCLLTATL